MPIPKDDQTPLHVQRCAIYTRKSTDERLERDFNTLESQRELCAAYIKSQRHKGWIEIAERYDDAAQSGGNLVRPALQRLLGDIERGRVQIVVIYKIDRLTRSLGDFVRLVDLFDRYGASFVSITQSFDTSDSMGRLVMNVLLTFAQFEREMAADRIRDKVAAMKRRGKWTGGPPPLGYDVMAGKLVVNDAEAVIVRRVFERFIELKSYMELKRELQADRMLTKVWINRKGVRIGGKVVSSGMIYNMLASRFYVGEVPHFDESFPGEHEAIVPRDLWDAAQALRGERAMYKLDLGPSPNILLGILHDAHGRRMTIAEDNTKGRPYRYYISNQARWAVREKLKRVRAEAGALEQLVTAGLQTLVADRSATRGALSMLGELSIDSDALAGAGPAAGLRLGRMTIEQLRLTFNALLARIDVEPDLVRLLVRSAELHRFLRWNGTGLFRRDPNLKADVERVYAYVLPAATIRVERSLHLPIEPLYTVTTKPLQGLVALLDEAARARTEVFGDRTIGVAAVAARFGRRPSTFARLLRLNYLAPDIVTAILDGRQPAGINRRSLLNASLPMDWAMQRRLLGFPARSAVQGDEERY